MLQFRKLIACYLIWILCMGLCSCSDGSQVILIGEESGTGQSNATQEEASVRAAADAPESSFGKNQRKVSTLPSVMEENEDTIRVYVCGAVICPGVVALPAGSRVAEALEAAGGFGENANRTYVNLAAWVTDGQMLYFPTEEEIVEGEDRLLPAQGAGIEESVSDDSGLVNINTADVESLCSLPGIGESRAADIISYRETNGFFESCEDIMRVPGIKDGLYQKICDKITVE